MPLRRHTHPVGTRLSNEDDGCLDLCAAAVRRSDSLTIDDQTVGCQNSRLIATSSANCHNDATLYPSNRLKSE